MKTENTRKLNNRRKYQKNSLRVKIIKNLSRITKIPLKNIREDILIKQELGIDSLTAIEIIYNIEKKFKIKLDEKILFDVRNVKEFIELIELELKKPKK